VPPATEYIADFIGGFVAAEGSFVVSGQPSKFAFSVGLGATDSATCHSLQAFFGCGGIFTYARRKLHYDDECTFVIQSLRDHLAVTIPFMDVHLPVSYKREQYLVWRERLLEYWEHDAKRVRECTVAGCTAPRRARGLCRPHLYAVHGV
jgi:hypothetical protein